MKIYEPKKLVSPKEILDAVSTGKVQAGYATAVNWGGKTLRLVYFQQSLLVLKHLNI